MVNTGVPMNSIRNKSNGPATERWRLIKVGPDRDRRHAIATSHGKGVSHVPWASHSIHTRPRNPPEAVPRPPLDPEASPRSTTCLTTNPSGTAQAARPRRRVDQPVHRQRAVEVIRPEPVEESRASRVQRSTVALMSPRTSMFQRPMPTSIEQSPVDYRCRPGRPVREWSHRPR